MGNKLLDAALRYAEKGWKVVPLKPGKKRAIPGEWPRRATTDQAQICEWWRQTPNANIGIYCPGSGLVAIDIDVKDGVDGYASWQALGIDVDTVTNLTPSGGQHLIFRVNGYAVGDSVGKLGPGLDVRGNGLFVAPPSIVGGREYVWDASCHPLDMEPAELPAKLAELLQKNDKKKAPVVSGSIPYHTRNGTLASLAGSMRNRGMTENEMLAALLEVNGRCEPPLAVSEVQSIAKSIAKYEPGELTLQREPPRGEQAAVSGSPETSDVVGWVWRTLEQAYEEKPPREYVVPGVLSVPSLSIIFGPPGDLKTMLCQDLAVCVASGQPWLENLPHNTEPVKSFPVNQGAVLWVDVDNGLDRIERRFAAIGKGHNAPADSPLAFVSFPVPPFVACEFESTQLLLSAVQGTGAKLVVIDNLGAVSGGVDENSASMVAVLSGLRQIAEQGQCAVVVIHHKSKGTKDRAGDSLRGHSSIEGALDLALMIERNDDTVTLRSTKTRDIPVYPFSAMWTYDQDGDRELITGRFFGMGRPESGKLSKQEQAELCILHDMTSGMNQTQLVALVKQNAGVGKNTTLAAIRRLVDDGKLYGRVGQERGAIEYDKLV